MKNMVYRYPQVSSEQRLAALFIRDAVEDLDGPYRDDVLDWFNERSQKPFGYGWCLKVCGVNPNEIRRQIDEIMKTHIPHKERQHG